MQVIAASSLEARVRHPTKLTWKADAPRYEELVCSKNSEFVRIREKHIHDAAFEAGHALLVEDSVGNLLAGCVMYQLEGHGRPVLAESGTVISTLPGFGLQPIMMRIMTLKHFFFDEPKDIIAVCAETNERSIKGIEAIPYVQADASTFGRLQGVRPVEEGKRLYWYDEAYACQIASSLLRLKQNPTVTNSSGAILRLNLDIPLFQLDILERYLRIECASYIQSCGNGPAS